MERTFQELRTVNRWLGGHKIALRELRPLIKESGRKHPGIPLQLIDFGTGSADVPAAVVHWTRANRYPIHVTAIDINFMVCRIAQKYTRDLKEVEVVQANVLRPSIKASACDFVFCSLFLHHFSDAQIAAILRDFVRMAHGKVIVVDLHRHWLAYAAIRLWTLLFAKSRAVRNDGPLSVLRAFTREELTRILKNAGITGAKIKWRWPFRYVLIIPP